MSEKRNYTEFEILVDPDDVDEPSRPVRRSPQRDRPPQKKSVPKALKVVTIGVLGFVVLLQVLVSIAENDGDISGSPASTEQQRFEQARSQFHEQYEDARNDIVAESTFKEANQWTHRFARGANYIFENWKGEITNIGSSDGKASVSICSDSQGIDVEYHDFSIATDSEIYLELVTIEEGDTVFFSGMLVPDDEKGIKEASFTQSGSLENPEFYVNILRLGRSMHLSLSQAEKDEIASQLAADAKAEEELNKQEEAAGKKPRRNPWNGNIYEVTEYMDRTLLDPESFEAIEWSPVIFSKDCWSVRCKYRAKNTLGGYVIANQVFFIRGGKVDRVMDWQ